MALQYNDFISRYPEFADIQEWQYNEALMLSEGTFSNKCFGSDEDKYNTILGYLTAHILWFMTQGSSDASSGMDTGSIKDTTSESLGGASVSFAQVQGKYNVPFGSGFYNTSRYGQLFAKMASLCGYRATII